MATDGFARLLDRAGNRRVALCDGNDAIAVLADHGDDAVDEIAEVIGELGVIPLVHGLVRDAAVTTEAHVAQQVEAKRVDAIGLDHGERIEHVADRLRHLRVAHRQVAVDHQPLRQRIARAQQHGRPDDGVELEDVLGQQLPARRPVAAGQILARARIRERRGVVEQRVKPHVTRLLRRPRERHAPVD